MLALGRAARRSARAVALASTAVKNEGLLAAAAALRARVQEIVAANALDMAAAEAAGVAKAQLDRLMLDGQRIEAMAKGLDDIAALPDPVGRVLATFERPNGRKIERVSTPPGACPLYPSDPSHPVCGRMRRVCVRAYDK